MNSLTLIGRFGIFYSLEDTSIVNNSQLVKLFQKSEYLISDVIPLVAFFKNNKISSLSHHHVNVAI